MQYAACGMSSLMQLAASPFTAQLLNCKSSVLSCLNHIHFTPNVDALSLTAANVNENILHEELFRQFNHITRTALVRKLVWWPCEGLVRLMLG